MKKLGLTLLLCVVLSIPAFAGVGNLCPGNYLYKLNLIGSGAKNPTLTAGSGKRFS